jgi:hypothetical protein
VSRMRITPLDEIVIRDLDDLKKSASGLSRIWSIGQNAYPPIPWYMVFQRFVNDRYGTYERSRKRLYTLLQLDHWNKLLRTIALWEVIKVAYGRDFFDNIQEQKEKEMNRLTQNVRLFMKKIGEVLLEYKNLFGLQSDGPPIRPEAEAYMTQILSHPNEEYTSYFERYDDELSEDVIKRIGNLRAIREKALGIFRQTSPELCEMIERTERELFATIKITDLQERTEPVDLRLIDSVLKCTCTHHPACYEGGFRSRDPTAFAKEVLSCPNVGEILGKGSQELRGKATALFVNRLGRIANALIAIYCDFYIPVKHRKDLEGMKDFRQFEEETVKEQLPKADVRT